MYEVDDRDRILEREDIPRCEPGAPCPIVLTGEHSLSVLYYAHEDEPYGATVQGSDIAERSVVVRFQGPYARMFGPPNEEAMMGHPLARRGVSPYGSFEVLGSSWIRRLERMNSVHPSHNKDRFANLRHFILTFHDTTFECVAKGYTFAIVSGAPRTAAVAELRNIE